MGDAYRLDPPPSEAKFLRQSKKEHACRPPRYAKRGDVWRCHCQRRWTCVDHMTRSPARVTLEAHWERRYWPWPR